MNAFTNICRTCMKTCKESLISLFSTQICFSKSMQFKEILWECTSVQISSNDDLPKSICEKCADQLKIAYEFKLMCHNTEKELLKLIGKEEASNIKNELAIKEEIISIETVNIKNEQINTLSVDEKFTDELDNTDDWQINNEIEPEQKLIVTIKTKQIHRTLKPFKKGAECNEYAKVINKNNDIQTHSCEETYLCQVCSESFTTKSDLSEHLKNHSENNDNLDDNSQENEEQTEGIHPDLEYVRNIPKEQFKVGVKCNKCTRTLFSRSDMEIHVIRHIGIKKFPCPLCSRSFVVFYDLTNHKKKIHSSNKDNPQEKKSTVSSFECKMCSKTFPRKKTYDSHMIRHHGVKKFTCDLCPKRFVSQYDLKRHLRTHGDLSDFQSKHCIRNFDTDVKIDENMIENANLSSKTISGCFELNDTHMNSSTENSSAVSEFGERDVLKSNDLTKSQSIANETLSTDFEYLKSISKIQFKNGVKCVQCPRVLYRRLDMEKHISRHLEIKKFSCEICGKSFVVISDLTRHKKTVHSSLKFKCEVCPKEFMTVRYLKRHLRIHGELTGFHCKHCSKSFDTGDELKVHAVEHENDTPHICQECGKQFSKRENLHLHKAVHTGKKPYLCTVCGRAFALSSNLIVHMRIHSGEKPYACKVCGKTFAQWASLRGHLPSHSDEKQFVCQTCGKAFSRNNALRAHLRRHAGVRNFPCTKCEKRFYSSDGLRRHFVTHTGEKNFKCEFCDKAFNRSSTLRVHAKIHSGERPFVCTVCERSFLQKHCLISHMNTHK